MQLDVTCVASGAFADKILCGSQSAVVGEAYEGKLLVAMTTAACSISVAGADEFATEIRVDIFIRVSHRCQLRRLLQIFGVMSLGLVPNYMVLI